MIADYQDGGQNMLLPVDAIYFNKYKALKISNKHISNDCDCKSKWKCFFDCHLTRGGRK